jgi:hypothetical protein
VQERFCEEYPLLYVPGPWLRYHNEHERKARWCKPDGLFMDFRRGLVTVVEVKLKHTADAWWQLRRVYEPVLRTLLGPDDWRYAFLEVVRWYDPHIAFPQAHAMIAEPARMSPDSFGVHIWGRR